MPGGVTFENAWIRPPVGSQTIAAGYCDIVNDGEDSVVLTEFADAAGERHIEIHETTEQDGMVRMRPLTQLTIASGETLSLRPGGKHLMLFGMDSEVQAVDVHARFADGAERVVRFQVRPAALDSRDGT